MGFPYNNKPLSSEEERFVKRAKEQMPTITKIVNSEIDDVSKFYIMQWYVGGWRDEAWVDAEIEYAMQCKNET